MRASVSLLVRSGQNFQSADLLARRGEGAADGQVLRSPTQSCLSAAG